MRPLKKNIWFVTVFFWFMVLMAFPNLGSGIKYLMLMLTVISTILFQHLSIKKIDILWFVVLECLFGFCLVNSYLNGFEIDFKLCEIYLVRPVLYMILTAVFFKVEDLKKLVKILLVVTLVIIFYNIVYIVQSLGIIPPIISADTAISVMDSSFLTFRLQNQTALCFTVPFIIYLYSIKEYIGIDKKLISITFWLGIIVALISGRRILQVLTILFLLITFVPKIKIKFEIRTFFKICFLIFLLVILITALNKILGFNIINSINSTIANAFEKSDYSGTVRSKQIETLLKDWTKKPILGWGLAAYSTEYYHYKAALWGRVSVTDKWSYEFYYLALLFQTGILGISILGGFIYRLLKSIYRFIKTTDNLEEKFLITAFFYGILSFFIAGATNPMITSTWFWFITLIIFRYADDY